ncbi:LLM class flavin-dependent oxidoreductase [Nocardia bhagyanarayanae]|uniref:Luciferase-like monooxygenase n=1 Tax=Nocardia bhagyanarayanae TaxID=1215925 RepID=A0A543F5Q2_9NOCA|nr:LLM class flavin-dependent oxidoreductase [Nocardia bhagyanarayanae]TQM29162.1 luciferase-like monooxygenase [Nocardia bhagyanarayanae]
MKFGMIVTPRSGAQWAESVRAAENEGYRTVLLPDTMYTPSPLPMLAAAAAVTGTVRLRPNVLAAPLRHSAALARDVAALQLLSGGRFELGIGIGRPDAAGEAARLGMPWGSARQRREQLREAVAAVRAAVEPAPEIVVAASGPRMLAAAAEIADRILLAAQPAATEADWADMVRVVRDHTDRDIRFTHQLVGIGDRLPFWLGKHMGLTAEGLRAANAAALLPETPAAAADLLETRREKYGIDELVVPDELAQAFTPVMRRFVPPSTDPR